jgi:DNA polymerase III alpha subunit
VPSTAELPRLAETERTLMSHHVTGFDIDGHPMRHLRDYLREMRIASLEELRAPERRHGERVTAALYEKEREIINGSGILAVRGRIGKEDGVVNLKAEAFFPLQLDHAAAVVRSHDYH